MHFEGFDPMVATARNVFFLLGRVILSSNLYKLEFFIVRSKFLSFFGMRSTKNMLEYSDLMTEELELT